MLRASASEMILSPSAREIVGSVIADSSVA
jgi:hypothetical protein